MQNNFWQDQFRVTRIYLANCEFSFPNRLIKLSKRKLWNFGICGSLPALRAFCRVDLLNPTHNVNELYIDYTRSGYKANKVNRSARQRRSFQACDFLNIFTPILRHNVFSFQDFVNCCFTTVRCYRISFDHDDFQILQTSPKNHCM